MPQRKLRRSVLFSRRQKRTNSQKRLDFTLALGIFVFIVGLFWITDGTVSANISQTLSFMQQKVNYSINKPVNELETQEYIESIKNSTGQFDSTQTSATFSNAEVQTPPQDIVKTDKGKNVLAAIYTSDGKEKWIEVSLSKQRLYAHEGESVAFDFPVSTGLKWTPTPTGTFHVWVKLRYANMVGGSKARGDYYNLPNVPYVMYFYQGYGIHGTYWHNNFGHPMSHGCVNVRNDNMAKLYNWAGPEMPAGKSVVYPTDDNPGVRVVIRS